jgi:hypothetical protein
MPEGRDVAEWKWPQWAGTLEQLHQAASLALPKLHAFAPFPEPYDADHPWDPQREERPINPRHQNYLEAVNVRKIEVVVEERDGYTHQAETLDYLTHIPDHTIGDIEKIVITLGKGYAPPGIELRVSSAGLATRIVGFERTWTAGLRHELEKALKPRWRLHAPAPFLPVVSDFTGIAFASFLVFVGLIVIFKAGSSWPRTPARSSHRPQAC